MRVRPSRKRDGDAALFIFCEQEWVTRFRRFTRAIPSSPRCKLCQFPFGGVGRILPGPKFTPSRKNPNFCKTCFEQAPVGSKDLEIGVLFADMRGYTTLSESLPPQEVVAVMNRFYAVAFDVLVRHDAVIDKLSGDEVMALFVPWTHNPDQDEMVNAGEELLREVGFGSGQEPWLPLGVGVDYGVASVGNVGPDEIKDFTAIGDVVNTASRLSHYAQAGQLVMTDRVRSTLRRDCSTLVGADVQLKGKSEPTRVHVISV